MIFWETSPTLTANDINDVERDLKLQLPGEFKAHYLIFNGGYPENRNYVWENGEKTRINTFSSIRYSGFDSLEDTYKTLVDLEHYLPEGIVPFAADDGGNFFCISCREHDFGAVYYCNNDHYSTADKEEFLTLLDNNFDQFINKLSQ